MSVQNPLTGAGATALAKAVIRENGRGRPQAVKHYQSEAARRYLFLNAGILEDNTPHLDVNTLRRLAERNGVIQAVVKTIVNQVAQHFTRPMSAQGIGIKVAQRETDKALTQAAAKEARRIEDLLFRGGMITEHPKTGEPAVWDGNYWTKADPLPVAIRKLCYDSLVLDRTFISIEGSPKIGSRRQHPVMFWKAEDAGLMRIVSTPDYQPRIRTGMEGTDDLTEQVQWIMLDPTNDWGVLREYRWDEGDMGLRNPRTEFQSFGYGRSEVEECLDAVLGVLYGMQANKEYFTSNHIPQGILNLIGNYQDQDVDKLRMALKQQVGVPGHMYEFPVIKSQPMQGAQAQWIPMMERERMDMVFTQFITFCVALVSAVFQIAPEEFGFAGFGGPQQVLSEADPESTIQQSQHKGLLPKVLFFRDFLSKNIVERLNPDFELQIQGLEARYNAEELAVAQLDLARMQLGMPFNMIRRMRDEPLVYDPLDLKLWRSLEDQHAEQWYPTEAARVEAIRKAYEAQGGELGSWPDAPTGSPALTVWQAEHQQPGQDANAMMDQMAQGDQQAQQQNELADQQAARDGMASQQQAEDERQAAKQQADDEAAQANELRIPAHDDAAAPFRKKPPAGGPSGGRAGGGKAGGFKKSLEPGEDGQTRVVIRIGPRDEE